MLAHLAESFRYAVSGVRKSDGIVAHRGTRFGGLGEFSEADIISCTVSNDGWTFFYLSISGERIDMWEVD